MSDVLMQVGISDDLSVTFIQALALECLARHAQDPGVFWPSPLEREIRDQAAALARRWVELLDVDFSAGEERTHLILQHREYDARVTTYTEARWVRGNYTAFSPEQFRVIQQKAVEICRKEDHFTYRVTFCDDMYDEGFEYILQDLLRHGPPGRPRFYTLTVVEHGGGVDGRAYFITADSIEVCRLAEWLSSRVNTLPPLPVVRPAAEPEDKTPTHGEGDVDNG